MPAAPPIVRDTLVARMAIMDRIDALLRTEGADSKDEHERLRNALMAAYAHEGTPVPMALVEQAIRDHFHRSPTHSVVEAPSAPLPWKRPQTRHEWQAQVNQADNQILAAQQADVQHSRWHLGLALLGLTLGLMGAIELMQRCYPHDPSAQVLGALLVGPFAFGVPLVFGFTALFRWLNEARLSRRGVLRPDEAEGVRDGLKAFAKSMAALQRWSTVPANRAHLTRIHASRVPLLNLDAQQLEAAWREQQATRLHQQRALRHARDNLRQRSEAQETDVKWTHYMETLAAGQRRAEITGSSPVAQRS